MSRDNLSISYNGSLRYVIYRIMVKHYEKRTRIIILSLIFIESERKREFLRYSMAYETWRFNVAFIGPLNNPYYQSNLTNT